MNISLFHRRIIIVFSDRSLCTLRRSGCEAGLSRLSHRRAARPRRQDPGHAGGGAGESGASRYPGLWGCQEHARLQIRARSGSLCTCNYIRRAHRCGWPGDRHTRGRAGQGCPSRRSCPSTTRSRSKAIATNGNGRSPKLYGQILARK